MAHIFTYEEIKQEFEDRGYILLTDHKLKTGEKYEYICGIHKDCGVQLIDWMHFHNRQQGCKYCGREKCDAARRKDLSNYDGKRLAESKGFEYVNMARHDNKIWVQFICPKHREYGVQEMPYNNMKRVVIGCQHCIGRNDDEDVVLAEMHAANPNIVLLEPYQGRTKRIKMKCLIHEVESTKTPYEVICGRGCYWCGLEKLSAYQRKSQDKFVDELYSKYPTISLISGYTAKTERANFHCNICDASWTDIADYVTRRGCPRCNSTSTESKVGKILQQYKINYIPQYSFNDCRDKRALPFDYYIPDHNILIEYDGEQHYMPVNFGGISDDEAGENLKITQLHDKIKTEYCNTNDIVLIRIPYWEKNNLENVLISSLKQYVLI